MRTALCALALPALSAIASADVVAPPADGPHSRFTAGVDLGLTQASKDADNYDANHTLGLFARVNLTPRLSAQLEVTKLDTDDDSTSIRVYSANVVIDIANGGHWMPMILAGIGLDRTSTTYGYDTHAHHIEGGVGVEYRADGGFIAGVDLRLGGRTIDDQPVYYADGAAKAGPVIHLAPASNLSDGEYRSARLYMGVHF